MVITIANAAFGKDNVQICDTILVDAQLEVGVLVGRHLAEEEGVAASHRSREDAAVDVVGITDVGDGVVELDDLVLTQRCTMV